jgi:transposase
MKLVGILFAPPTSPATKQRVTLSAVERRTLTQLLASGTAPTRALTHARILLKADDGPTGPGWSDVRIGDALEVSLATIVRVRRAYRSGGLDVALHRKAPDRVYPHKLDGRQEAHLIALACAIPPAGHARWTLRLLTDRVVELTGNPVSDETVRRTLKKTSSSRG